MGRIWARLAYGALALLPVCAFAAGTGAAATSTSPASSGTGISPANQPKIVIGAPLGAASTPAAPVKASGNSCMCAYQDGLCVAGTWAWSSSLQDKIAARTRSGEPLVRAQDFAAACADRSPDDVRVRSITYVDQQGPKAIIEWEVSARPATSSDTRNPASAREPVIIRSQH
jgi:hypothetical protein